MFFKKPPFNKPPFWSFISTFLFAIMELTTFDTIPGVSDILKERGTINKFRGIVERLKDSETVNGLDKIWKKYCDTERYGEGREFSS